MKTYLEYSDEKSSKFWEVVSDEARLTIRYGKIGSEGKILVKTFESSEKTLKERDKLVKSKTKKGYEIVDGSDTAFETISLEKAEEIIQIHKKGFEKECLDLLGAWWHVEETIDYASESIKANRYNIPHCSLINGDLETDTLVGEYDSLLIVLGNLTVKRAMIRCMVIVTGKVTIQESGVFESMGDNTLYVGKSLTAMELIEIDHHFKVEGDFEVDDIHFERGCEFDDVAFHPECFYSEEEQEEWLPEFELVAARIEKGLPVFVFD